MISCTTRIQRRELGRAGEQKIILKLNPDRLNVDCRVFIHSAKKKGLNKTCEFSNYLF
jgi:hypothetical protein